MDDQGNLIKAKPQQGTDGHRATDSSLELAEV